MMPAMRQVEPMTPRASRPWRLRLGLKNRRTEKIYHDPRKKPSVACAGRRVHICPQMDDSIMNALGSINQNSLWASCLWGAVASGYCIYGWKQKMMIPFFGGLAMTAASFLLGALTMSLASIAIMFAVWWLLRQGY